MRCFCYALLRSSPLLQGGVETLTRFNQKAIREHGIFALKGEHAMVSDLTKSTQAISLLTTKKLGILGLSQELVNLYAWLSPTLILILVMISTYSRHLVGTWFAHSLITFKILFHGVNEHSKVVDHKNKIKNWKKGKLIMKIIPPCQYLIDFKTWFYDDKVWLFVIFLHFLIVVLQKIMLIE